MNAQKSNTALQFDNESDDQSLNEEELDYQFLTFKLAGEEYGISITKVQEIKGWCPVTKIPNTPDYVSGVLNIRGNIVPIIDVRARFNLEKIEYTPTTVIIVLSIVSESRKKDVGIVVDAVSDVLNVNKEHIKETPELGDNVDVEFLNGMTSTGDQMVMLLNIDKLLQSGDLDMLDSTVDQAGQD